MDDQPTRVLLLNNTNDNMQWLQVLLANISSTNGNVVQVDGFDKGQGNVGEGEYEMGLLGVDLSDYPGLDDLIQRVPHISQIPIMVLMRLGDKALTLQTVRLNAQDYLLEERIDSNLLAHISHFVIEQRRTEAALQTSESRLRKVITHNSDAIVVVDSDGIVQFVNPAAVALFGRPEDELLKSQFGFPVIADETTEMDIVRRNATVCVAEMRVVPLEWDGRPAFLTSLRDITDRKRVAQQQLEMEKEEQRVRVLKEFLAGVSHDIKTPLTQIDLSIAALRRIVETEKQRARVTLLEAQVAHLQHLLLDMLTVSQLDLDTEFEFETCNLNALIQEILEKQKPRALQKNHVLEFVPEARFMVEADAVYLSHAITNVIVNAVEYTPDGGSITVRTARRGQHVVIEVEDSGIGINSDDLPHIFERFYRADKARNTQSGGGGFGLAITQKIIDKHGGKIEVESEPGKGSIFRFVLQEKMQ